ncbi:NACHT domain-containing protein [Streptomyces sp. NPDC015414]|uniref:NACHT domain-containing protein n=1 Tax=Streptomyces sp. NPDC015414 TaxID=3364957 RepID=UPI0036F59001
MRASRTRRVTVIYVLLVVAGTGVMLWLSMQFHAGSVVSVVNVLAPTLAGTYIAGAAYYAERHEAAMDVDAMATRLAIAVAANESQQRVQLIGPGVHRIDLSFTYRPERANNAEGAGPYGRLTDVVTYYRNLSPARLIITGEGGSGKTVLAIDLILGLLNTSQGPGDPIPVRVSLASWDTDRSLRTWLSEQIHRQFGEHGLTAADAAALVDQHRILPILDGLDEMDTDATLPGRGHAVRALQQINAYPHPTGHAPFILTCRTVEYEHLTALGVHMREAARIEIDPVGPGQARAYLSARSSSPERWRSVLSALTRPYGAVLARGLSTPWRLNLAATAYEERHPGTLHHLRAPADLLALASPSAVRDHLLACYLPAATRSHPTQPGRYQPEKTHRWLAALAIHLSTATPAAGGANSDITLAQLWPMAGQRRVRAADVGCALPVTFAFTTLALALASSSASLRNSASAILIALVGLGIVWQASRTSSLQQRISRLERRLPARRYAFTSTLGLALGLGAGLMWGLLLGLVAGLATGLARTAVDGFVVGLLRGLAFGLSLGLPAILGITLLFLIVVTIGGAIQLRGSALPPIDPAPIDPLRQVQRELRVGLGFGAVYGVIGLVGGFLIAPQWEGIFRVDAAFRIEYAIIGLTVGLVYGLVPGLYLLGWSGRRYLIFLVLCCTRGQLPWRLGSYLRWAYEAGFLRISGVAYQFRHQELQEWLTANPHP